MSIFSLFRKRPVVRLAPSPTGLLHVGTARTALFNVLFTRKYGGRYIVRIEDTDAKRSTKEFEKNILEGLSWLGLSGDALYRQSERRAIYRRHLERLMREGRAYESDEESKERPGERVKVVRLRNPDKVVTFHDEIRGDIATDTTELGDIVIARSIDDPLFHLAVVVDDLEMGVTHVIRGEDHISNTPRQILIQEALGAPTPRYLHLPLLLGKDRSKLSKRHGAVSMDWYRDEGFLPEALVNYLALLGWTPPGDAEVLSLHELITLFDPARLHRAGAIFDREKLTWLNHQYLRALSSDAYFKALKDFAARAGQALPEDLPSRRFIEGVVHERATTLKAALEECIDATYVRSRPRFAREGLFWKDITDAAVIAGNLRAVGEVLATMEEPRSPEDIKRAIMPTAEREGRGATLWPTRFALSGRDKSPDPFTLVWILGKTEALYRIASARDLLGER